MVVFGADSLTIDVGVDVERATTVVRGTERPAVETGVVDEQVDRLAGRHQIGDRGVDRRSVGQVEGDDPLAAFAHLGRDRTAGGADNRHASVGERVDE